MDANSYDQRDASQQCLAFLGFTFLLSWAIWAGLWAPGISRAPFASGVIMAVGWWGPAVAARLTLSLYRARRGEILASPEREPARSREYLRATLLVLAIASATIGLAIATGASAWQWTWGQTGWPLAFGGPLSYVSLEIYDLLNRAGMVAQTVVVEAFYWLWLMILLAGAEIGWRGVFLPRLLQAGYSKWIASVITGALFGVWLWPLVWNGSVTGFYPGAPLVGMLVAVASGAAWGSLLGWLYFRNERVGPVVFAAVWIGWIVAVLPLACAPHNMLWYADPRSLSAAAVAGAASAALWRFFPAFVAENAVFDVARRDAA